MAQYDWLVSALSTKQGYDQVRVNNFYAMTTTSFVTRQNVENNDW